MKVRIGIDVGGTFTDVVVIDGNSHELVGQLKLPTSHAAKEGVALGIVTALERAMTEFNLRAEDVAFIAHSTTQATNALLEGDVAEVGVVGIGGGAAFSLEGWLAKRATQVPPIVLTASKSLCVEQAFVRAANGATESGIEQAIQSLAEKGVRVIVASEAFGVDQTAREELVAERAKAKGLLATTGHEVSSLYGLRVRTRTAVINAAILPKMIETAEMTEACVKDTGIRAPLMIMRSDGGVMSVAEVHRRPILTMLSGPAAGIAGALMHERVSDGVFIEVGGTSADISVIRDGNPATRPARLNGHRMYLNTLDVRTLGVGGGSMVRVAPEHPTHLISDVGPRSAHIAGLGYVCFAEPEEFINAEVELMQPTPSDAADHLVIRGASGKRYAVTTTCAANLLGLVEPSHFAFGKKESVTRGFKLLADRFGTTPETIAEQILTVGCRKIAATIDELIPEYHLSRDQVVLVGGGGGAASLVPFTAKLMGLQHRIARNAEVISPIGVAMAMVRDTVERNIVDPTPEDILKVRREAAEAAIAAGAVADSIEVQVEVDKRRNLVRATAMGTTELRRRDEQEAISSFEHCREAAARSMRLAPGEVLLVAETSAYLVFIGSRRTKTFFGLFHSVRRWLRVVDRTGVVRLQRGQALVSETALANIQGALEQAVESLTDYGDAGRAIPDIFILYGARIANFSGLADLEQVKALVEVELRSLDPATKLLVIACPKQI
ncbi:MAG TPA: hydantoinase/oxoprolinase family protein [Blastocatellia bacterium]|nr:hydantoinase/oxoprolinase family protein [Blastocatellia bacterium]HMZ16952.1 hydantoinase/oxoprolinase family protein [Blastocatellia bacterium]HNG34438.1 hydantoinase/oxoprolinase family protein [Blastocatellia bacterium]